MTNRWTRERDLLAERVVELNRELHEANERARMWKACAKRYRRELRDLCDAIRDMCAPKLTKPWQPIQVAGEVARLRHDFADMQAQRDEARAALEQARGEVPDCVKRWREIAPGVMSAPQWDDIVGASPAAREVLTWLATAPDPGAVLVAESGDVEALQRLQDRWAGRFLDVSQPIEEIRALGYAKVLDRAELVAWLRELDEQHADLQAQVVRALDWLLEDDHAR